MTDRVDLTVSIVSYHVADELRDCLGSVVESAPRHRLEVIVVDNASGAPTQAVLDDFEHHPLVRSIRNEDNRGFAAANNQALRQAQGRYFMLLNPDCRGRRCPERDDRGDGRGPRARRLCAAVAG